MIVREMDIAAIIGTHGSPELTLDTIDSVKHYMTDKVLLAVDEAGWQNFEHMKLPVYKLKCFYHNFPRAPYRNVILSLLSACQQWPKVDWLCYLEYDCLVGSAVFRRDLAAAAKNNV